MASLWPDLVRRPATVEWYEPILVLLPEMVTLGEHARVDSFVKIEGGLGVSIGAYAHICSFAHLNIGGGRVEIGDHAGVSSGAKVLGGSNKPEGLSMSAASPALMQVVERKLTRLGAYSFVGVNAVVMAGVTIGDGAVIGGGAVVTKDVPAWEIWAGVPARKIGVRPWEALRERYAEESGAAIMQAIS